MIKRIVWDQDMNSLKRMMHRKKHRSDHSHSPESGCLNCSDQHNFCPNCLDYQFNCNVPCKKCHPEKKKESRDKSSDSEKEKDKKKKNKKNKLKDPKKDKDKDKSSPKPIKKKSKKIAIQPGVYLQFDDVKGVKNDKHEPDEDEVEDDQDYVVGDEDDPDAAEAELAQRRLKAKSSLRKVLWTSAYPILLENDVIKRILARKNIQLKSLIDKQSGALKSLTSWVFDLTGPSFNNIFTDRTLSYDFFGVDEKKKPKELVKQTRAKLLQFKITNILEELNENIRLQPLGPSDLDYLASISLKEIYVQSNVFSNYEVMRFEFNTYGRILDLTKAQTQMILAVNLLVRILIYKLIVGVKAWYQGPLPEEALLNFKIIGSVLYQLIYSIWERRNPVINPNPSKLPLLTTKPLIIDPTIKDDNLSPDEPDIIVGGFNKEQLSLVLDNLDWVTTSTDLILQWIDEVHKKVLIYRKLHPQDLKNV